MRSLSWGVVAILIGTLVGFASTDGSGVPEQVSLGTLANLYPPVQFDHTEHAEIEGNCAGCHHQLFGEPEACGTCHEESIKPSAFVHELHWEVEDCTGCHHRTATGGLRCVSCHAVEPDLDRLEVIGLKGAYHGLCLRCHLESDSNESCGLCHPVR